VGSSLLPKGYLRFFPTGRPEREADHYPSWCCTSLNTGSNLPRTSFFHIYKLHFTEHVPCTYDPNPKTDLDWYKWTFTVFPFSILSFCGTDEKCIHNFGRQKTWRDEITRNPWRGWEDNIRMDLTYIGWEDVNWIQMAVTGTSGGLLRTQ
jgi:hypothetical protein